MNENIPLINSLGRRVSSSLPVEMPSCHSNMLTSFHHTIGTRDEDGSVMKVIDINVLRSRLGVKNNN